MDQQTFELLRVLQSGERSEGGLAYVRQLLDPQRRALHASDDRASLSDISELLEDWAETAPPTVAAAAIAHAAQIAEQDLEQAERAVQLYTSSLERDPTQSAVIDQLEALLLQLKQGARLEPILLNAAKALRAQGDAGAEPAATVLRRLGRYRLAQGANLDGAISAYEQALELNARIELIRELAELYSKRGSDGDRRQAADLYATLGEVLGEGEGTALVERALDLAPGHVEALVLLESHTPEAERAARLAPRWAAFVRASDDPLATGPRRLLLARAFGARGDHHGALEWLAPIAEQGDAEALELQAQALAAIAQADSPTRASGAASAKAAAAAKPTSAKSASTTPAVKGASAQSASTTPAVKGASAQSASSTPAAKSASSQSASSTPAVKSATGKSASSTPAAKSASVKSASAPAAKSTGNGPAAKKAATQPAAGGPAAAGKKGAAARPHTLVGFRVPVSVHSADDSSAPGARKPRKPRSGDTIVGFRVPEALAATAAERAADAAGKRAAAATSANAASSSAPALRGGASVAKPAASAARAAGPAAAAAALRAGGKPAAAASARPAPGSAVAARSAPSRNGAAAAAATLTPAQRSAALRTSGPAHTDEPAAQPQAPAGLSPAAITNAAGLSPAAITNAAGLSPAAITNAAGLSPAAMHAVALRATSPASAPVAGAAQAPPGSSPPAFAARLSQPSQPASVQPAAMPGAVAFAQAQGALATAAAPAMIANPAAMPIPAPRSSDRVRRDDELSGVRARPRFLDRRTLTIGGAVLLGVVGAVVLFSGKSEPAAPPASSADAPHADTPPAPPASAASAPATAASTGTTTASGSAPGATPSGSAALPSTLAAAVAPRAPAAPPPSVKAEPAPGRVEVQVSEISIKGGKLRTKDVLVALGDGLKDVEHCYEEVLEDRPKTSGALDYSFTVDRKGNATKIKKAGGTIKDSRLLKCTARAIEKADFPKPKSKPAQVTLPLEFKKS